MPLSPLPLFAAIPVLMGVSNTGILPDSWAGALAMFLIGIVVTLLLRKWARPRPMAILYTGTREDAPTWLRRNRDALITNVSAVFFAVGLIVGQAG